MEDLTLSRTEWAAVSRELDATMRGVSPSDLRSRIADLLADIPAAWEDQACSLFLDESAVAIVQKILGHGPSADAEQDRATGLAEAVDLIHEHQSQLGQSGYRIEHRIDGETVILGHTSATRARQADLSAHASRLMAAGAHGELVLVDLETGEVVARRHLRSSPDDEGELAVVRS